ncbi:VOC family protein [Enterococcus sp.]|jgi:predicted lactoylglutathione lyase|uniref:VOC family protein n=1 Tax=Enterococcus sp. TaxID=35783 RepID=UPI0025BA34E7|nr:VOC family protein [Enterococcus sp.]
MGKMVFINFPVRDIKRATSFYEALGFSKNEEFSNETSSGMMWNETIWVMLSEYAFYEQFLNGREIADTQKTNAALIAFSFDTPEGARKFAKAAEANGGHSFQVEMGIPEEEMLGFEVIDPDGNQLESVWMKGYGAAE